METNWKEDMEPISDLQQGPKMVIIELNKCSRLDILLHPMNGLGVSGLVLDKGLLTALVFSDMVVFHFSLSLCIIWECS